MISIIDSFYKKISSKKNSFFIWILLFSILSSAYLFGRGFSDGHDTGFHLYRVIAVFDNIRVGKMSPIYFNYLNGLGYGAGLFYSDLFLYIPAFFYKLGFSLILSVKIFLFIVNFFSIYTMYLCVHNICQDKRSTFCAMFLYAFSTYRLVDSVNRFALGEVISFVFFPLVILGLYEILYGDLKKSFYFTIGLVGLCFSHIISLYLTSIFVVLIIVLCAKQLKEKDRLKCLLFTGFFSVLITCCFWGPMFEQILCSKFNFNRRVNFWYNVVPFFILFCDYPVNNIFGKWFPSGIGLIYYVYLKRMFTFSKNNKFIFIITILGFFSVLLSCCGFILKTNLFYKVFNIIQFPWRFYFFATVFLTISLAYALKYFKIFRLIKVYLVYVLLIFLISNIAYFSIERISGPIGGQIGDGEYLPIEMSRLKLRDLIYSERCNFDYLYERDDNVLTVDILRSNNKIEVPLLYYKGYKACGVSKCYDVYKTENGLVGIKTDGYIGKLKVEYDGTKVYYGTRFISLFSIVLFIVIFKIGVIRKYEN